MVLDTSQNASNVEYGFVSHFQELRQSVVPATLRERKDTVSQIVAPRLDQPQLLAPLGTSVSSNRHAVLLAHPTDLVGIEVAPEAPIFNNQIGLNVSDGILNELPRNVPIRVLIRGSRSNPVDGRIYPKVP